MRAEPWRPSPCGDGWAGWALGKRLPSLPSGWWDGAVATVGLLFCPMTFTHLPRFVWWTDYVEWETWREDEIRMALGTYLSSVCSTQRKNMFYWAGQRKKKYLLLLVLAAAVFSLSCVLGEWGLKIKGDIFYFFTFNPLLQLILIILKFITWGIKRGLMDLVQNATDKS